VGLIAITQAVMAVSLFFVQRRVSANRDLIDARAQSTYESFVDVARDIASVVGVRDSMDQEIRERQNAVDTSARLVARQGRILSDHIESNLHR